MRPTERIDRFFPINFRNKVVVKQFSKPCLQCGLMLESKHMHGIVRLLDDHLILAATATCPQCRAQFGISCVIDQQKQVRRVILPSWLLRLYLRALPLQPGEKAQSVMRKQARQLAETSPAASESRGKTTAAIDYPRADVVVGQYAGKAIPAWIIVNGHEVPFDHVNIEGRIGAGEYLIDGCLVYK